MHPHGAEADRQGLPSAQPLSAPYIPDDEQLEAARWRIAQLEDTVTKYSKYRWDTTWLTCI